MKKSLIILILSSLAVNCLNAQVYRKYIKEGDSLYKAKQYSLSLKAYQKAFKMGAKGWGGILPYNAACTAALAGKTEIAFHFLNLALEKGYMNVAHLKKDDDLMPLHKDKRWLPFIKEVKTNKEAINKKYGKKVRQELLSIYNKDQEPRNKYVSALKKYNYDNKNPIIDSLRQLILHNDSINRIKVSNILDSVGWLGENILGRKRAAALFLVIQHAPLTMQKKYLPMMHKAVQTGKLRSNYYAMFKDRVLLRQGKKQIYGTQMIRDKKTNKYYVAPLKKIESVDERRAKVGLGSLSDYVKYWGIDWNVEKYKEKLPKIEKLEWPKKEK